MVSRIAPPVTNNKYYGMHNNKEAESVNSNIDKYNGGMWYR